MRLDLFLKWCRVIARRPLAKATCDASRIKVNGKLARPGYQIQAEDIVVLDLPNRIMKLKVLALPDRAPGKVESRKMIEVLENVRKKDDA